MWMQVYCAVYLTPPASSWVLSPKFYSFISSNIITDGSPSAAELNSGNNPPIFIYGKPIEQPYADELRMWIDMMDAD